MTEQQEDLEIMMNVERWEQRPYLPLKKGNEEKLQKLIDAEHLTEEQYEQVGKLVQFGFLIEGFGCMVFIGYYHKRSTHHIKYESLQAILADGWSID